MCRSAVAYRWTNESDPAPVYNEDEKPTFAIVNVRGTRFTERTDSIGRFTIKAPKNGVLLVGHNGKPTIEVKVKPTLKVILKDKQE